MIYPKSSCARLISGVAALLTVAACGGSSTDDSGAGGSASGGASSGGSGAKAGSSGSGASGGSGGSIPCTSFVPCCDSVGNTVDPICDSNGMPQCPKGSTFPKSGICTPSSCTSQSGCSASEFCDFPDDLCGTGQPGTCKSRPDGCDLLYDPVCTCAGDVAGNACAANAGGQDVSADACALPDAG